MDKASKRATMPKGANAVLDRRTIYNANKNLLLLVKPGHYVLDVGCGSGTITKGISELVGEDGLVLGLDPSIHLIDLANNHCNIKNINFEVGDINNFKTTNYFDIVTSARTLQWLANPIEVLRKMLTLIKKGGTISILDYNHDKIQWSPKVPPSMKNFYEAFLSWRSDAGMDNKIADNLEVAFRTLGLQNIVVSDQSEYTDNSMEDAHGAFSIWSTVAETRGKQLVEDGYITNELRLKAIEDYNAWIKDEAVSMTLYMRSVTGYL